MTKTKSKPESGGVDLIENPDAIVSKAEDFFNSKRNQNFVFGIGGAVALVAAAFVFYQVWIGDRNQEAQEEMFQAVYYFESDSLGKALNGDGNNYGFLDIMDLYSGTKAAGLANFYAGATYLKLTDYESAIRYLEDFSGSDELLQSRAYALMGDAYVELDDLGSAISSYRQAVNYRPNEQFTPSYLVKLALAQEAQGDIQGAIESYETIVDEYKNSSLLQTAQKHAARLKGLVAD